jgi:hypothetical protein
MPARPALRGGRKPAAGRRHADRGRVRARRPCDPHDPEGQLLGRGLVAYDASDAALVLGKASRDIEAVLGYPRPRRDDPPGRHGARAGLSFLTGRLSPANLGLERDDPRRQRIAHHATNETADVGRVMQELGRRARTAARKRRARPAEQRNAALLAMAEALRGTAKILAANAQDLADGKAAGLSASFMDRLALDEKRLAAIADAVARDRRPARSARPRAGGMDPAERPALSVSRRRSASSA